MSIEYLTKSRIDRKVLAEIAAQLKKEKEGCRTFEDKMVLDKIVEDLGREIDGKAPNPDIFYLEENEHNYLSQNDRSLWADYLIFRYKFRMYPMLKRLTDFPVHLLVEIASCCNLRCSKCFQTDPTFSKGSYMGFMDIGLFKKIIDEAVERGNRALTMASRGEPTMHPRFGEILEYLKGKFFDIKINTNAMLLTEEKCHQVLQSGITELVFSVDSSRKAEYESICKNGDFDLVVNNIKRFHEIRAKDYPGSKCKTRVSRVKYDRSFDEKQFVEYWKEIVDDVVCVEIVKNLWNAYDNKPNDDNAACPLLWQRVYIWFDGTVNPCDYDYKSLLNMGDVKKEPIRDIWLGGQFKKLREDHMQGSRSKHIPCDRCYRYGC